MQVPKLIDVFNAKGEVEITTQMGVYRGTIRDHTDMYVYLKTDDDQFMLIPHATTRLILINPPDRKEKVLRSFRKDTIEEEA